MTKNEAINFLHIETFSVFSREFPTEMGLVHLTTYESYETKCKENIDVYSIAFSTKRKDHRVTNENFCFIVHNDCQYYFDTTLEGVAKIKEAIIIIETKDF